MIHLGLWFLGFDPFKLFVDCTIFSVFLTFCEISLIPSTWISSSKIRIAAVNLVFGAGLAVLFLGFLKKERTDLLDVFIERHLWVLPMLLLAAILLVWRNYRAFRQLTLDGFSMK